MWTHENYNVQKRKYFTADYVTIGDRRFFRLTHTTSDKKTEVFTFDSWQSAKKNGWVKVR